MKAVTADGQWVWGGRPLWGEDWCFSSFNQDFCDPCPQRNSTCHVLSSVTLSISLGEVGNIIAKLSKEVN